LAAGIFTMMGGVAQAQDATTDQSASSSPAQAAPAATQNLKGVVVTGSLIRRVDYETASPVVTVDRSTITDSGKPTLGDVLQQLPSISGNAVNTQVNGNGGGVASPLSEGGAGTARVSLRGLGINRSLVLVDGQRMVNADLNLIPQSMIERVDVLGEGASTTYGSDAIGGVVNFILRKDFQGVEFSADAGISSHGDAQRHAFNLTTGKTTDKYNIVFGVGDNKYYPMLQSRRDWSSQGYQLRNGVLSTSGSTYIPAGRIQVPASIANRYGCPVSSSGTSYVTLAKPDGTSLDDYRCWNAAADIYNTSRTGYLQTAQERANAFLLGSYNLTDNLSAYAHAFYNHTHSSGQDAPSPVAVLDGLTISASNPINPFGVTFSANPIPGDPDSGYSFQSRLTSSGTRVHTFETDTGQFTAGLLGHFGQSSWNWNASLNYGHTKRVQSDTNEIIMSALQATVDSGGNIFNQINADKDLQATLKQGVATPVYVLVNSSKQVQFDTNGDLWEMPAGTAQLSVGSLYRTQFMNYTVTDNVVLNPVTGNCIVLQEACGSPGRGTYNVKELYAETLIPLLADKPWAHSLNIDLGVRSSDYSMSGTTTNKKIAIEWRPIADLLVRGTLSQVFRAPNLNELYDGITLIQPGLNDPCVGLSSEQLAQHARACQYVPPNWGGNSSQQVNTYYSGAATVGNKLKPEHGNSVDFGLVYNPDWIPGLSTTIDFWHINLRDTLTAITGVTVVNACFANESSPYCSLIQRYDTTTKQPGQVQVINTPVVNLGTVSTTGVDYTLAYQIPHFDLGSVNPGDFVARLNTSYTSTFNVNANPGSVGATTINYAGTGAGQFGNLTRWRGTATLGWKLGNWSAQWQSRYLHKLSVLNVDRVTGASFPVGSVVYHALQLGYQVPSIHTHFSVGVDNLSDKDPPSVLYADPSTYDRIGRYYWARATVKF
jgi:outer membrane receptor protein involved in Fe transport